MKSASAKYPSGAAVKSPDGVMLGFAEVLAVVEAVVAVETVLPCVSVELCVCADCCVCPVVTAPEAVEEPLTAVVSVVCVADCVMMLPLKSVRMVTTALWVVVVPASPVTKPLSSVVVCGIFVSGSVSEASGLSG